MSERIYRTLSVHELVDFLLRRGDIDNRVYNYETMQMGSKIHSSYQKKQGNSYLSEVALKGTFDRPLGVITLEGRADGIILKGDYPVIDEIKSTVQDLETFYQEQKEWHLGQAKCYALMYAKANKVDEIGISLTYISQNEDKRMIKEFRYSLVELETDVNALLDAYLSFLSVHQNHIEKRNLSIESLSFPFPSFRPGQREMSKYIYGTIKNGGLFYLEAPTGIGKTMSALFPAIKGFEEANIDKIFYLTAKSTGRESAYNALTRLYEKGFVGRDSSLKAKDKMCFLPGSACNPDECPFAKGYYDKIALIREEALSSRERFSSDYVVSLAEKYAVCPFELQLDLSLYSDIIICDYNYLFDPIVHLERYFDTVDSSRNYVALIDESHNLVERGRSMYSSELSLKMVFDAKKSLSRIKATGLKRALTKLISFFEDEDNGEPTHLYDVFPEELLKRIDAVERAERKAQRDAPFRAPGAYRDYSREAHRLSFLAENYRNGAICYMKSDRYGLAFHLDCLDASPYFSETLSHLSAAVFFSGTLTPVTFYQEAIAGEKESPSLLLPSPFPPENICLTIVPNLSIRYKDRERTYEDVASYLKKFAEKKAGNYFLYFPSYEYLANIREYLSFENADVYVQQSKMSEEERTDFLSNFIAEPKKTTIALLVLGGAFGEGVDLLGDRLSGVAIVGIGMPTISFERNLLRTYFDEHDKPGFAYAYLNPGINKVMQALGRLIRSENDRGAALLIDDRYLNREYREIYARLYPNYSVATSPFDLDLILDEFYKE